MKEGTPKQISGRAKEEGCYNISLKTIYSAIKEGLLLEDISELLPRKGKRKPNGTKETGGTLSDKKMIKERSKEAKERSEVGHFESDTIIGRGKQGTIMTHVFRKSRFLIAELMENRKSTTFSQATIENFKYLLKHVVKTFTSDNGKEFSKFKDIEVELEARFYFANPYHSWERETNEGIILKF